MSMMLNPRLVKQLLVTQIVGEWAKSFEMLSHGFSSTVPPGPPRQLLRQCDVHNVALATNRATAELLVHAVIQEEAS